MVKLNGLDITENQFLTLSSKERDLMMFRNVVYIRSGLRDYKFHKKVQYAWLSVLTAIVASLVGVKVWIFGG